MSIDEAWIPPADDNGGDVLTEVENFLARFVVYPSEAARIAHVLWVGHTWFMDEWDSTPRIAFLSPEPGSGKSRALEVMEHLVPRAVHCVNVSPAYLFRRVSAEDGAPTLLYDEVDTVFGPKAKDNEDIRGMLNAGHRRGATAGRCERRGDQMVTLDYPSYCAVALAGLDDLPDTIMTRSVVIRMRRRSPDEKVEPWRQRLNGPQGERVGARLLEWSNENRHRITWPELPEGIEDRNADVWEALIAVADLAGGSWPERARVSAVSLVTAARQGGGSFGVMLLRDLHRVFGDAERLSTETILDRLHLIDESPWADLRGKPLDARGLARRLSKYGQGENRIAPKVFRDGETTIRGYAAGDLLDAWQRYLPTEVTDTTPKGQDIPPRGIGKGGVGEEDAEIEGGQSAPVTDVTSETSETAPGCTTCSEPLDTAAALVGTSTCSTCEMLQLTR